MRLYIEQVGAKYRVGFNLIQHDLAAKMLVAEIQALLTHSIGLNLIAFELFSVVNNNFFYLLVDSLDVVAASLKPVLLAVVLYLKHSVRNDLVNQVGVIL